MTHPVGAGRGDPVEPLYAIAGILVVWLVSLVWARHTGTESLADDLRAMRERAERAEALAEARKADLVEAGKRQTIAVAALQRAVEREEAAGHVVHGPPGVGPADLRAALASLLRARGRDPGGPPEAGEAGAGAEAANDGRTHGLGGGGGRG
jgi:hypothetical protein